MPSNSIGSYSEFRDRIEDDAALSLLRLDNAPLFLSFLHSAFQQEHAVVRLEGDLVDRLAAHLEHVNDIEPTSPFTKSPGEYLDSWAGKGILTRRHNDDMDVVYELNPGTERALAIVQGIDRQKSVGAESKLKLIARTLHDLSENSDLDVDRRIRTLEEKVKLLRDEIHDLRLGVPPKVYSGNEKRERYRLAVYLGRDLQRDFGIIRERFIALARSVAASYASTGVNRGDVLRRALDENSILRKSPEGQSFSAFQSFLLDPVSQAEFRRLVDDAEAMEDIASDDRAGGFLLNLPGILLREAQAVVATNERLSEQLRRVLDSAAANSRAETHAIVREIMALAYEVKQSPPEKLLEFNAEPDLRASHAAVRPLWVEPAVPPLLSATESADGGDADDLAKGIINLAMVDLERLKAQIEIGFSDLGNGFTLRELVDRFPPAKHLFVLDILGYIELARRDLEYCRFREDSNNSFLIRVPETELALRIPDIEFYCFDKSPIPQ